MPTQDSSHAFSPSLEDLMGLSKAAPMAPAVVLHADPAVRLDAEITARREREEEQSDRRRVAEKLERRLKPLPA